MNKILIAASLCFVTCSEPKDAGRFNYRVVGDGHPTIVVEMAMGEVIGSWDTLQTRLGTLTKVVTYDRLGLGRSDTTTVPRTIENLSKELNQFLAGNKVPTPYLLVGHSLGTLVIRRYQIDHPENVVGMVLIDPVHEDQFDRLMALKSPEEREKTLRGREEFLSTLKPGELNEAVQYHQQRRAMKGVTYPANIPVTILGSFQVGHGATEEDRQVKRELFNRWLTQAPQIRLIETTNSGHYIQDSEPELVINEIQLMLEKIRKDQ